MSKPGADPSSGIGSGEGGPFGFGNQVLISSHRKLLRSKSVVVSVAEKSLCLVRYSTERF